MIVETDITNSNNCAISERAFGHITRLDLDSSSVVNTDVIYHFIQALVFEIMVIRTASDARCCQDELKQLVSLGFFNLQDFRTDIIET